MKNIWRELEAREIIFKPGKVKVSPGEVVDLHFTTEINEDILIRIEKQDGVSIEKNEFLIKNGSAVVSMTPTIPGSFKIIISSLVGQAPLYYLKNENKVFIFSGENLEIGEIEAIW